LRLFGEAPAPPAEIESREKKMAQTFTGRKRVRKFFGTIQEVAEMPNLIEVQKASYDQFLLVKEPMGGRPDEACDTCQRMSCGAEAQACVSDQ